MSEKVFPIMSAWKEVSKPFPRQIPWSIAELAYSVYTSKYGSEQSLERLAQRGGFHHQEMDDLLPDWRERCSEVTHLQAALDLKTRQLEAAVAGLEHYANVFLPTDMKPGYDRAQQVLDEIAGMEEKDGD